MKKMIVIECRHCKKISIKEKRKFGHNGRGSFCNPECFYAWRRSQKGPLSGNWKGGRIKDAGGYIRIHCPDHPEAQQGYVYEHRLIAEKILGRRLFPKEVVHHMDSNRENNSQENLKVFDCQEDHHTFHLYGDSLKEKKDESVPF